MSKSPQDMIRKLQDAAANTQKQHEQMRKTAEELTKQKEAKKNANTQSNG